MIGPSTERRGIPGGLRAQLLVGFCLLLAVGFGLAAVVAEHAIQRQLPAQTAEQSADQGTEQAAATSNDKITDTRKLLLIYLGFDAFFILLVGYAFFTYVVMRPLRAIGVASERAARGDLASPISVLPPNEFGQVGRQFNQMLGELRKNRAQLEERLEELDQANQQLRQTQDSLIRSEKLASVGQLAAGVAHEVGNPLAAISGYLELLDGGDLGEEVTADILKRSQKEVDRMRDIIRDLLDYSRDDAEAAVEQVNLGVCVEEAVNLVKAQPKSRSVKIVAELPDDLAQVSAVDSQVVQVLVNLFINAVDAINADTSERDEDASITIEATYREDAAQVVLAVRDDGPGIPAEKLQRVFDPFFTTKDPGEGTGLGLAICLRIMRRLGGDIHVDSAEGEGTTFELIFPKQASSNQQA
jgi:signal transduction histidine kinase